MRVERIREGESGENKGGGEGKGERERAEERV